MQLNSIIKLMAMSPIFSSARRWRILRLAGVRATQVGFESGVQIRASQLTIGRGSYINVGVLFEGRAAIVIGDNVAIGPRVMVLTSTHPIGPSDWRAGEGQVVSAPVTIGDGVWIGAGAIILPGATIERGCVIAAGAVVTGHCAADQLWAGVPAEAKRPLLVTPVCGGSVRSGRQTGFVQSS